MPRPHGPASARRVASCHFEGIRSPRASKSAKMHRPSYFWRLERLSLVRCAFPKKRAHAAPTFWPSCRVELINKSWLVILATEGWRHLHCTFAQLKANRAALWARLSQPRMARGSTSLSTFSRKDTPLVRAGYGDMALAATDGMMDRTANYGYINRQAWHQGTPGPPQTHFCWPGSGVGRPGSLWVDLFSSWSAAEREK